MMISITFFSWRSSPVIIMPPRHHATEALTPRVSPPARAVPLPVAGPRHLEVRAQPGATLPGAAGSVWGGRPFVSRRRPGCSSSQHAAGSPSAACSRLPRCIAPGGVQLAPRTSRRALTLSCSRSRSLSRAAAVGYLAGDGARAAGAPARLPCRTRSPAPAGQADLRRMCLTGCGPVCFAPPGGAHQCASPGHSQFQPVNVHHQC
jgi:hypothetical protein